MTKIFKFDNKNNNTIKFNGINGSNSTNYSEILDNIIAADIIKKNKYLFKTADEDLYDTLISDDILIKGNPLKASDDFTKATLFLANYKKYKKTYKLPYILGKMYTLADGTPIVFYDDEIQIGFDTYRYTDFTDFSFLSGLKASTKKTIINIYTNGAAYININL